MVHIRPLQFAAIVCGFAGLSSAQTGSPSEPFAVPGDIYVTDSVSDLIYRIVDVNMDGDGNDLGEVTVFYDDTLGAVPLGNNSNLSFGPTGVLYVTDSATNKIVRLIDINGDGSCHDPTEATVFFDGDPMVNASGIEMAAPAGVSIGTNQVVFVADSDSGGSGLDGILRLTDLNLDGDANDAGEAIRLYTPPGGTGGHSIPSDVIIGIDGKLYYVESSSTGLYAKGIYQLDDADNDDFIDPVTEVTQFFVPTPGGSLEFIWTLTQDAAGNIYTSDTGNDIIWRVRDDNSDGVITNATEASAFLTAPGASLVWDVSVSADGTLICVEDQAPDRVLRMKDLNSDGVIDVFTELENVYNQAISATSIGNVRGLTWERQPQLTVDATTSPGSTAAFQVEATENDTVILYLSTGTTAPVPLAPFGYSELAFVSPDTFLQVFSTFAPILVPLAVNLPIPNDPSLSGLSFGFQALVGKPDRLQITNLQILNIL
ncbi:MAG: hypothetical protein P8R48_11365 [Planctomycetota bacterium]|nr:hypothetical protein [Planctomycetota bacterium]